MSGQVGSNERPQEGNLQVWKVNDCDWYAAISFSEAVEYAIANGADKECIFEHREGRLQPLPLTEEELRAMTISDPDDGPNGEKISGWEHLRRLQSTERAAVFFASTEY